MNVAYMISRYRGYFAKPKSKTINVLGLDVESVNIILIDWKTPM